MKLLIENKKDLTLLVSKIETFIGRTYLEARHQKLKECIAVSLGFKKFASALSSFPLTVETETFFLDFFENYDKMFAVKANDKQVFFASQLQAIFIRDHVSDDFDKCIETLLRLEQPEIFLNRGWGDMPLAISIINDGDGQFPYLYITKKVFDQLKEKELIGDNVLQTFKARKLHCFDKEKYLSMKN